MPEWIVELQLEYECGDDNFLIIVRKSYKNKYFHFYISRKYFISKALKHVDYKTPFLSWEKIIT